MPEILISKIIFWLLEYSIFDVRFSTINVVSQYSIKNVITLTLISFVSQREANLSTRKEEKNESGINRWDIYHPEPMTWQMTTKNLRKRSF